MTTTPNHAVCELGRSRIALRRGLVFTPQAFAGKDYVIIEDPLNSKFHRVGTREYAFLSLLDGMTSIADALQIVAAASPGTALTEHEAAALCKWLMDAELAATAESSQPDNLSRAARKNERGGAARMWNPLSMQWPLLAPDQLFEAITPGFAWLFSWWSLAAWVVAVLVASYQVWGGWPSFSASLADVFVPGNWLWLGLCWVALKVVHETAHGVVCKKYGGTVRVAGVMFVLFAPIAYVDVTSSWRLRSKWQRMHISTAGIYLETFIAALAAIGWCYTEPGVLNYICLNLAVMASATTLLVNANPLMRFDGYYILSDFLELPNLHSLGQQWLVSWTRRGLLGMPSQPPAFPPGWGLFIRAYTLAAFVWRIIVCAGLVVTAAGLFHGAGIVLAAFAVIAWVALPIWRFLKLLLGGQAWQRPSCRRLALVSGAAASLLAAFFVVPWPGASLSPAVVEYAGLVQVRAGASGFVRELRVANGDVVEPGQVLAELENPQLEFELADLELTLRQSELSSRANITRQKLTESQAEMEKIAALHTRIAEKQAQVAQLKVRAATRGQVVGRNLEDLSGSYLREGDLLFELGNEGHKELQVSVGQDDLNSFVSQVDESIRARVPGVGKLSVQLSGIEPRASLQPKHLSLCAIVGGPIPVKRTGDHKKAEESADAQSDQYEYLSPRFNGVVALTPEQSEAVRCGQTSVVWFRPASESVGLHFYNQLARWLRENLTQRKSSSG